MILYINTTDKDKVKIVVKNGGVELAGVEFGARMQQAEKLLPAIDKLLKDNKIKLSDLKEIIVENYGGSFTSLRIGVITANALGFALGIPVKKAGEGKKVRKMVGEGFDVVEPIYDREPNITISRNS